jgi:hypothetical protein
MCEMENREPRQSCAARLLDVRSYVIAARLGLRDAEPAAALFMVVAFGLLVLVLFPIWVSFDLLSTWDFTTCLRNASEDVIFDAASYADAMIGMSVGAALTGVIFTGFTMLPSLFEVAFPTVSHPLLNLILWGSIIFDFVTDWGKAASVTTTWTENPVIRFVYTIFFCAFVSVGVQALLVVCITVVLYGCITLVRGGARQAKAVVIEQR